MPALTEIVLYATGSPLVVDVAESLARAGATVRAAVRNRPGEDFLGERTRTVVPEALPPELLEFPFLVPLFTPANRWAATREALARGFRHQATLVDPTTIAPRHLLVGPGSYVNAGCTLGADIRIGASVIVNRASSIGHHGIIEDFASIGPGCTLAGQVFVGRGVMIGTGSVVVPGVRIGAGATVAAGSVVRRDVPPRTLVAGNPARRVRSDLASPVPLDRDQG
jgi:sugar O-acyltransferase (sialic acid O-acetyltransferase NeuD family)